MVLHSDGKLETILFHFFFAYCQTIVTENVNDLLKMEKRTFKSLTSWSAIFFKDWIEFEEIAELEERAKSQFFEKVHEEVVQKTQEAAKEREFQSVKAAADVVHEVRRCTPTVR